MLAMRQVILFEMFSMFDVRFLIFDFFCFNQKVVDRMPVHALISDRFKFVFREYFFLKNNTNRVISSGRWPDDALLCAMRAALVIDLIKLVLVQTFVNIFDQALTMSTSAVPLLSSSATSTTPMLNSLGS